MIFLFFPPPHLVWDCNDPRHSRPRPVYQQLTRVCVDEVKSVFHHVRWDFFQNEQIAPHGIFALPHFLIELLIDPTVLRHELLPEELGPHGQNVLVSRKSAITSLKRHIVDAVHFVRLIQKAPEVLGEG